jgi:putative hemolysin
VRASSEPELTEEEIKALIRQGAASGVFEEAEHAMVQRVFRLGDRPIKSIMTPRTEICWLDSEAPTSETLEQVMESIHSRFPVGRGSLDECLGIVRGRTILELQLAGELGNAGSTLEPLLQPPLYVAEGARALGVIEQFRKTGVHIALVTDEYGGIEGLVTLNDLMEAIVGDLPSAEDEEEPQVVERADGSWLLDGALDISDFKELVNRRELPDEASGSFHTLGGFVMHYLQHIPRTGESFVWSGLKLEVMDMDGKRVDKMLVSPLGEPEETSDN